MSDLITKHLRVAEATGAVPKPKSHRSLINYVQVVKKITLDPWQRDLCGRLEKALWLSRADWLEQDYETINIGAGEPYIETPSGFRILLKEYEVERGRGSHAAIHAPPQHGKTIIISQCYPAWVLGFDPTHRFRYASNAITHSRTMFSEPVLQILRSDEHCEFFPSDDSRVPDRLNALKWSTNARKAVADGQSSFSALGLQSGFVGTGFDTFVADDPYKSDEEAMSEIIRDKTWRFYANTVRPRWAEHSNEFIMFHRYHQDDMGGRALLTGYFQLWRYAAQADGDYLDEESEQTFPCLPIGRKLDEYLCPRKTARYYAEQKKNEGVWSSQFQGRPSTKSGKIFDVTLFQFIQGNQIPKMVATVRAWDNASTEGGGAYSAGVKVGIDAAENVYVFDSVRKQVGTAERELLQRQVADRDGKLTHIHGPEDPGSAGSDIAFDFEQTFQRLGFTVSTDKAGAREDAAGQRSHNRTKIQRAYVASKTVNSSKAYIVMVQEHRKDCVSDNCACPWVMPKWWKKFKSECAFFPAGTYKDQVDAFSDAHNYLKRVFYRGLVVKNASNLNLLQWSRFRHRFGDKIPENFEVSCGVRMAPDSSKPSGFCITARAPDNALMGEVVFAVAAERMFVSDPLEVLIRLRRALERTCENGERHARIIYYNSDAPKVFHVAAQKLDMYIAEFKEEITAGLRELNWYVDPLPGIRSPFYDRIGTSRLLVLVDDHQLLDHDIVDEDGMLSLRQDFGNWSYNEQGLPQIYGGIILDCMRMTLYRFALSAVGLTDDERKFARLPQHLQPQEVVKLKGTPQFVETILAQEHALTIDRIRQYETKKKDQREANRNGSFLGKHAVVRRFRKAM